MSKGDSLLESKGSVTGVINSSIVLARDVFRMAIDSQKGIGPRRRTFASEWLNLYPFKRTIVIVTP